MPERPIKIVQPVIEKAEIDGVVAVLRSGTIAQGPVTAEFEAEFARFCGVKHAVATSNGTTALHAALLALGIKAGDEVITTPFTFVATANAILMTGARPVFVDINPVTYTIDPKLIEAVITPKTKAIVPVDLYGQAADWADIQAIAAKHQLKILNDSCQAIGATYQGKKVGSLNDVSCFSLYATKNITTGEGGMVTTNDDQIAEKVRVLRHHGQSETERYKYLGLGYNYRLTDIGAALGLAQLKKIDKLTQARQANAAYYDEALKGVPGLILPTIGPDRSHAFHQYTLRVTTELPLDRDGLAATLKDQAIASGVYYPIPLHQFPHLSFGRRYHLPEAELAAKQVLSIPVHPRLTTRDRQRITAAILSVVRAITAIKKGAR